MLGSVYALIALGYSMVYGILKLLNFAHGDVYMIGAFIGFGVLTLLGGPLNPAIPVGGCSSLCMFVVAMLGSGFLGVAIERFAYRPLRDAPRIAPLIRALGVAFFLENSALLLFGSQFRNYDGVRPDQLQRHPHRRRQRRLHPVPRADRHRRAPSSLMVALLALVRWTQLGKAMRARLVRPRGGRDDGHRHRPRDRRHVLHRLRARRRGRRDVRPALQPDLPPHGLPRRAQGVHGRRRRRHRQHPRRDARRAARRPRRVVGDGLPERQRLRPRRLRDPDRVMLVRPSGLLGTPALQKV